MTLRDSEYSTSKKAHLWLLATICRGLLVVGLTHMIHDYYTGARSIEDYSSVCDATLKYTCKYIIRISWKLLTLNYIIINHNNNSPHHWPLRRGTHDDVIKLKHILRCWPFVRGIHRPPVNSPHKGQWISEIMTSFWLTCLIKGKVFMTVQIQLEKYFNYKADH